MTTETGTDIAKAASLLRSGELVAIPTETVYGLAGNALNENAVLKIFKAKERPQFNPLIIHLPDWKEVSKYAKEIPASADLLADAFAPGPITFLLPKSPIIPDLVTAGSAKVAIRIPGHPLTHQLLQAINFPLAAPSANRFGYVSPVTAAHVKDGLDGRIPYILDGGPCGVGVESTIVDFENDEIIIRRTGKISAEQIASVSKKRVILRTSSENHPVAPGMLRSHYATKTPLIVGDLDLLNKQFGSKTRLILGWGTVADLLHESGIKVVSEEVKCFSLSPARDIDEVARNLFSTMRQADNIGVDVILVHPFPDVGIGKAVNDRLNRAQHAFK